MILEYSAHPNPPPILTELHPRGGAQSDSKRRGGVVLRFVDGRYIILDLTSGVSLECVERLGDRAFLWLPRRGGERGLTVRIVGEGETFFSPFYFSAPKGKNRVCVWNPVCSLIGPHITGELRLVGRAVCFVMGLMARYSMSEFVCGKAGNIGER
jgi:hypothetical protein